MFPIRDILMIYRSTRRILGKNPNICLHIIKQYNRIAIIDVHQYNTKSYTPYTYATYR